MKHVNLRLPDDLHEQARAAADADDRSLNSWLVAVVRRAVTLGKTPNRPEGDSATPAPLRGSGHSPQP
ncbi:Arc family DNA-binding protein [Streptomyces sp. NBC_00878]|uniref:Arc family DNA-binding protein n=1 Tax=Streptomyces sp. NBC_00878 TaxID=2975854 RepID=UPI002257044A|nr:Arc family DNA-binding protein [Streptomyces sp. NBC_00878]MCX4910032.1 Arc family DNA-binding protein [Streptomyces sp. NBC_00878]